MGWVTTYSVTLNADTSHGVARTTTSKIVAADMAQSGTKFRITLRGPASGSTSVVAVYAGHGTGGADDFEASPGPVQVLFGGVGNPTLSANTDYLSDEVTYSVDETKDFVVSIAISSSTARTVNSGSGGGYEQNGNVASTVDKSGSLSGIWKVSSVKLIEVYQTTAYTLAVGAGSYSYTGVAAALNRGKTLAAAAGSYAYNGVAALFRRTAVAATGVYTYTGVAVALRYGYSLAAAAGSYAYNGVAALFHASLFAVTGVYALTGVAAGLKVAYRFAAAAGAYTYNGIAVNLRRGSILVAATGVYIVTGIANILARVTLPTLYKKVRNSLPFLKQSPRNSDPSLKE